MIRRWRSLSGDRSPPSAPGSPLVFGHTSARGPLPVPRRGKNPRKTYSIYREGQKKVVGRGGRKRNGSRQARGLPVPSTNPVIVVEHTDSPDPEEIVRDKPKCRLKLSDMFGKKETKDDIYNEKKKNGQTTLNKKKPRKAMSHIRAKWLLGLSLTMVGDYNVAAPHADSLES